MFALFILNNPHVECFHEFKKRIQSGPIIIFMENIFLIRHTDILTNTITLFIKLPIKYEIFKKGIPCQFTRPTSVKLPTFFLITKKIFDINLRFLLELC